MTHRVAFVRCRIRTHDSDLGCDVLTTFGYRAECSCGQRSKVTRSRRELNEWKRAHVH